MLSLRLILVKAKLNLIVKHFTENKKGFVRLMEKAEIILVCKNLRYHLIKF